MRKYGFLRSQLLCLGNDVIVGLPYLIYKCLLMLIVLAHQILKMYKWGHFGNYFVYATHWGQMLTTIAFSLDFTLVLSRFIIQAKIYIPSSTMKTQTNLVLLLLLGRLDRQDSTEDFCKFNCSKALSYTTLTGRTAMRKL